MPPVALGNMFIATHKNHDIVAYPFLSDLEL